MGNARSTLLTLALGVAATQVARRAVDVELKPLLARLGLSKKPSASSARLAWLGAGALAAGAAGYLLAPVLRGEAAKRTSRDPEASDKSGDAATVEVEPLRSRAQEA